MSTDSGLVGCLVERLTTRLPHRTGNLVDLENDDIIKITRSTLLRISTTSISVVLDSLLHLLEDLSGNFKYAASQPPHVVLSELHVVFLFADCCAANWEAVRQRAATTRSDDDDGDDDGDDTNKSNNNDDDNEDNDNERTRSSKGKVHNPDLEDTSPLPPRDVARGGEPWARSGDSTHIVPPPLGESLVMRTFDMLSLMVDPITDGYVLPSRSILSDDVPTLRSVNVDAIAAKLYHNPAASVTTAELLELYNVELARAVKMITQFVTASSWSTSFDYFREIVYAARSVLLNQVTPAVTTPPGDDERAALVMLRIGCNFWINGQKLGYLIKELCSSFLHFRKCFQNTISVVTPLVIMRWVERNPAEFVEMHTLRNRLDPSVDTLFDMTQTVADSARRRSALFPLQASLLFLIPDVFEVASNMRDAKGVSMQKKITFLDHLRKTLKNGNESSAYCLVSILRAARHFHAEGESAMLSYAMDVQDEVREAVFKRNSSHPDGAVFDQDLLTATFVSLTHLNFKTSAETLITTCLAPNAPQSFKSALVQGCSYFARLPDADNYQPLFTIVSSFIQGQLRTLAEHAVDTHAGMMPIQKKQVKRDMTPSSQGFIYDIFEFLDAHTTTLFDGAPPDDAQRDRFYESNFESFMWCLISVDDKVRRRAASVARQLLGNTQLLEKLRRTQCLDRKQFKHNFWRLSSQVLMNMCDQIDVQGREAGLKSIYSYLEMRILLLDFLPELSELSEEIPERTATSTKLETLFLVSLCSAKVEVCQLVTHCIHLFLDECRKIDTASGGAKSSSTFIRNGDVFREIASRSFRFTGLVAFQTRIRTLLRKMQYPSLGILEAWEIGFERWMLLAREVSAITMDKIAETTLMEWRNFSGFLASLGGLCTVEHSYTLEEPAIANFRWIDRYFGQSGEEPLLTRYLKVSIHLLACSNVKAREAMRQILATEVSPILFPPLFRAIETELEMLFSGSMDLTGRGQDAEVLFAEQMATLLRSLIERLDSPADLGAASSIHLGQLTFNFAKFLDGVADNASSLRVKIKVCQLGEAVTRRKEHLNFRDDVRIRNQLLEHIYGWISRPRSPPRLDMMPSARQDESVRLQKDLDKAGLKALTEITYRLPLQPNDGQNDANINELKSQMFHQYFNRFLALLNYDTADYRSDFGTTTITRDDGTSTSDLSIHILSNLLNANVDVGLEHSLNIGYHENVEIRTAFVKVLHNILLQGAEFSTLSDAAVTEKYDELLDLLTQDTALAAAMSAVCTSQEVDELTMSLLSIYETRGRTFELMEALVKQEIEDTENESELLRRTCVATKMLSVYAKWKGQDYLKETLQKVIERLMITSEDLNFELDPARVTARDELQKNTVQLCTVTTVFIDDICASSAHIPSAFRKICSTISESVVTRFPESKYTAVGAFIFLRFFCPAIVAPDVEGLVSSPPSKEMRRGLLLIAKIIQNLANNVLFGAKEPYMYPLNDFLTNHIYLVTTFLREIAVPPAAVEEPQVPPTENFDFGACVALHRYLYDHWDQVRQRLMAQERRDFIRLPADVSRDRLPVLEPLRALITNLGPPPLTVAWNRPQVSINSPPGYARFQDFMLRHAARNAETLSTSRAIYDAGENKDGLSIICIVLRNIDMESIEYETVIYCFLKLASRLWHKRFGLLVDGTCFNGQNEPQDDLFKRLELLMPAEISKQLAKVYIYNMNSAFRKCFRRMLRIVAKNETSVFHPRNIEYQMLGTLQDFHAHFIFNQLHLPKDTVNVVTDTRYVFQPITRLSKTKGKIDAIIKIGSQFVQVTTAKKQEVHQQYRLNTVINDIFRLADIDEAPTPMHTDDDMAFGLRADNGRVVMYFTSPKKHEVLHTIRAARQMFKDTRALKPYERFIRPQDVPGTLLNLAFTNLASPDPVLRLSSYNLLGSLCRTFKFSVASHLMCASDISVPLDPSTFVVDISKRLAISEPQLTSDFLNEFFVGWESFSDYQKPLSLAYMAPWLPGLRTSLLPSESEGEKGREKIALIFRKVISVAVTDPSLSLAFEHTVWPAIYQDEVLLEVLLDEIFKLAQPLELHDERFENLTSIVAAIGTVTLRGKVISRLKKALNRSSLRPSKTLPDNVVWPEICVLLHFAVALSFCNGVQAQLWLPEIFHIVTMLANTGPLDIRLLVHRLLTNSIHSACTFFPLDEARLSKLRGTLESLSGSRSDVFYTPSVLGRDGVSISANNQESSPNLSAIENLATMMYEVCSVAATSVDMANAWRARWTSLVASTAFQNNLSIQPRAFTVMGCLAREEVDDDLLYQVLVALRNSVGRFGEENNSDMLVSIVTSLSKMMTKLQSASRYGLQLFWLAMSLVRLVPANLFNCAASFLESVLTNIGTSSEARGDKMVPFLLQGRLSLEEAAIPLDNAYGIVFDSRNFHHAVCATLVRGLTDTVTKGTALRVLGTFLEMTTTPNVNRFSASHATQADLAADVRLSPYMSLVISRAVNNDELKESLWVAGINPGSFSSQNIWEMRDLDRTSDKDMLLNESICLVDFQYLEDAVQNRALRWLNQLAIHRSDVTSYLCGPIIRILNDLLLHCQNNTTLESAHALLQTITSTARYQPALDAGARKLREILEDMGFSGLWRSCSFNQSYEPDRQCFLLTEKLIEHIIV